MKQALLISVIASIVLMSSCVTRHTKSQELFILHEMNEALSDFVESSKWEQHYFQVIIGENQQGAKISLFETKVRLNGDLYWFDPQKAEYLGLYVLGQDSIAVYAYSSDDLKDYINASALINCELKTTEDIDNIRVRDRYYQLTNSHFERMTASENRFIVHRYKSEVEGESAYFTLLISNEPRYYEMVLTDALVFGHWEEIDSTVLLNPFKLYGYSPARNELVELAFENSGIKDGRVLDCLSISQYRVVGDTLFPVNNHGVNIQFCWIRDER